MSFDPDAFLASQAATPPVALTQEVDTSGFNPDEFIADQMEEKYGTLPQQALAGAEGFLRGATFGTFTGIEKSIGENLGIEQLQGPAILARQEVNPVPSLGGEALSFAIPGLPVAKGVTKAGQVAARAAGMGDEVLKGGKLVYEAYNSPVAKVGSPAVALAVESAFAQGSNEFHKMLAGDPRQMSDTAISDIGLAAVLGGGLGAGFGVVSPLWKATSGKQLTGDLGKVVKRLNGELTPADDTVRGAANSLDLHLDPEINNFLTGDAVDVRRGNVLLEAKTQPALDFQQALDQTYDRVANKTLDLIGRSKDDLANLDNISPHAVGESAIDNIAVTVAQKFEPIVEKFDKVTKQFDNVPITQEADIVADRLANMAELEGWTAMPSGESYKIYNRVLNELPLQKTVENMRKYVSNLWKEARSNPALYYPTGKITGVLDDVLHETYLKQAGARGAKDLAEFSLAKEEYKAAKNILEELNGRLHVGKHSGSESFVKALKSNLNPETVLNRLSKKDDVGLQELLKAHFPEVMPIVQKHMLDKELKKVLKFSKGEHTINAKKLIENLDTKMTPELREFILPPGSQESLQKVKTILSHIELKKSSGTAGHAVDGLLSNGPGAAMAAISWFAGKNPVVGYLFGHFGKLLARDVPDAMRLGMMKFLGSSNKVEPEAFKTMVEFINHTIKGENKFAKATKAVFKAGAEVLPRTQMPDRKDREKLEKYLQKIQTNPEGMMGVGGKVGYYMPEQGSALAETSMAAVNFLNSMRPIDLKKSPLDTPIKPSQYEKAKYNLALDIAQEPLMVLESIKKGSVTQDEVHIFKSLYPALYQRTQTKLMNEIIEVSNNGETVPYKTRMGLSLFLEEPLDSTMTPESIMAAQATMPGAQPQEQDIPQAQNKTTVKNAEKLAGSTATPGQQREIARSSRA